jgi:thiol-disulfide isomerase/thioredoxin
MQPYVDFLYLVPNDSLHIEIDFKNLSTVQLSGGRSAEINRDFTKYFETTGYRTTYFNYRGVGTDCEINCSWDEIMEKMEEERNNYRDRRQAFLQKTNVCDEVIFLTEAMIELDYYKALVQTIWRRSSIYNKETMSKEALRRELDEAANKYFNSNLFSNSHFKFISRAYTLEVMRTAQPDKEIDFVNKINKTVKKGIVRDFIFTVEAGRALLTRDLDNFEKYSALVNNEYLLDRLMQEHRTVYSNMVNPENISSFILGNPSDFMSFGEKNLLAQIISQNNEKAQDNGKVQVINITAAWCAPCWPVLEQLAALMKKYTNKEVSFSFICVSSDNEETRKRYRQIGIDDMSVHFATEKESYF